MTARSNDIPADLIVHIGVSFTFQVATLIRANIDMKHPRDYPRVRVSNLLTCNAWIITVYLYRHVIQYHVRTVRTVRYILQCYFVQFLDLLGGNPDTRHR